jgi:hypothetical protein
LPSTSQTALPCSLLRPRDAFKSPELCSFSESQWSGSKQRYLGFTLDTQFTWSAHVNQVGKKAAQILGVLGPTLTGEAACPSDTACCCIDSFIRPTMATLVRSGSLLPAGTSGSCKCYNPSVFALRLKYLGTLVTGKFTGIWGFQSSATTSHH